MENKKDWSRGEAEMIVCQSRGKIRGTIVRK